MFGFLKDKLKSWLGTSQEEIVKKGKKTQKTEKVIEKTPSKTKPVKEEKVEKQEKVKKTKEELRQERRVTDKVFKDIKQEKIEIKSPEEKFEKVIREEADKEDKELEQKKEQLEELKQEIEQKEEKKGFFSKLRSFLAYSITEENFNDIFSELEMLLLESNVALEVVEKLREELAKELIGKEIKKDKLQEEIQNALKVAIEKMLTNPSDLIKDIKEHKKNSSEPYKILFFGINGAGKTTSIAKLTNLLQKNKFSCLLAAGDTFRAASIEQLQIHADKLGVKMIKQEYGSDPSAVAFDAIKYAKEHKIDVVLIDTAGRMHTKENLLHEMEKICRVTKPNLKVFVAEAVAGNDATEQAKAFNDMIGIDVSILSKTDVDEKGGTIISISYITKKPILYLGVGQKYDDLELFDKDKFIKRLGL